MRSFFLTPILFLFAVLMAARTPAVTVETLSINEAARHMATHVVTVTHADLTTTDVSTAQTLQLFSRPAGSGVRFVKSELITAFIDNADTNFVSTAVTVGDGGDVDRLLTSQELNSYGSEVYLKLAQGTAPIALTAATVATANATNDTTVITLANALKTEINKVITDLATTRTAALAGPNYVYASADTVDAVFTPTSSKALSALDAGEVRFYFVLDE